MVLEIWTTRDDPQDHPPPPPIYVKYRGGGTPVYAHPGYVPNNSSMLCYFLHVYMVYDCAMIPNE